MLSEQQKNSGFRRMTSRDGAMFGAMCLDPKIDGAIIDRTSERYPS
jgi:hypothetical protein